MMRAYSTQAIFLSFVTGLLALSASTAHAVRCEDHFPAPIFKKAEELKSRHVKNVLDQIIADFVTENFEQLFRGQKKITWQDYDAALRFIDKLSAANSTLSRKDRSALADATLDFIQSMKDKLKTDLESDSQKDKYKRFLDYNIAYFRLIEKINKLAKTEILPVPDFTLIESDQVLLQKGKDQVRKLESVVAEGFETTGHKTYEDYIKYTHEFSELAKKRSELIENDIVVAMHRPESARFWIPISGFQNQRITGSSKGSYYPDSTVTSISGRDKAEALLTQREPLDYMHESARFKPNYAEIRPDFKNKEVEPPTRADRYGSDLWIIKKKVLDERTTWSPTDSLGAGWSANGTKSWGQVFIPWKYRQLLTPFLLTHKSFVPEETLEGFKLQGEGVWTSNRYGYVEAQVWGPLQMTDVEAFVFKGTPPDKKFYELLLKNGIEVWDERVWPAKPYNGEESK